MELVDGDSESPTLISNLEVMQLLQKNIEERAKKNGQRKVKKRPNKQFRHRDWVETEVHRYLESTPCGKLDPDRRDEFYSKLKGNKKIRQKTASSTVATKQEDSVEEQQTQHYDTASASVPTGYNLTEAEALQIMNTMPSEPVEIHLMIDELQSRMSEERQEQFLEFIASYCKEDEEQNDTANATQEAEPMDEDDKEEDDIKIRQNGKKRQEGNGKKLRAAKVKEEVESEETGDFI